MERAAERSIATVAEIEALTAAMPERLRLIVLLATHCQLRRGELLGLRRRDIDVMHATIHIEQSRTFTMDGRSLTKQPKTAASKRSLAVPNNLMPSIIEHLDRFTDTDPDALVFTGQTGIPLTRNVLQTAWQRARATIKRPDLRLHDYADLRVMPTSLRCSSTAQVSRLKRSA